MIQLTANQDDERPGSRNRASHVEAPPWRVLVVDDEPEVHEVTHMMLWRTRFRGAGVELRSAYSAAEAKTILASDDEIALILLDVVMETDDAGLRLCHYVREELENDDVQIILRTGQPGQAPEREVILTYDINGYFLKTEMTSQKLHSVLISALRTYSYIKTLKAHRVRSLYPRRVPTSLLEYRPGIASRLRSSIEQDELTLLAQPRIDLVNGTVAGVEMILRWHTGTGVEISQDEIHAIADSKGLATDLAGWVLEKTCALTKAWQDYGLDSFRVAVKISPLQLSEGDFAALAKRCLEENGLSAASLEIQVAESNLSASHGECAATLTLLRELGVSITVDNFGTGGASLSELKQLHPDRLKIDRSFLESVTDNPENAAVTRAIIALAHTLEMSAVAEGVETEEQLEFLKWEECELAQGPYFSCPMCTDHVPELLRSIEAGVQ